MESDIIMAFAENEDMFSWNFVIQEYSLVRKNQPVLCVWWYFGGNAYCPLPYDPLLRAHSGAPQEVVDLLDS